MSKLDSISLSNMRKFGPDVTIELSPGATILLAPNGTGKTTVFEAIEFGLTGEIARLSDDILHVIRDDQEFAKVSLNFTGITATSQVTAAGEVSRHGDLTALFPGIPEKDVPFLLRLTHLLDQRENEWIVKAEEKEAGSQLARLPIGRDGSRARTTLAAVRRSLNDQKAREEEVLIDFEKELNEWNRLIQERDAAATGAVGALRPRDQLVRAISQAATQTQCLDQIPIALLSEPVSQNTLTLAHSALVEILHAKIERVRVLITNLAKADDLVENFSSVSSWLEKLNAQLVSTKKTRDAHSKVQSESAALLQEHQANILLARQERISVGQELERLVNEASARQQIDHRNEALAEAANAVGLAEDRCRHLREQYERHQQVRNQHAEVDSQLQSLDQSEKRMHEGQRLVVEWEATEERLRENRRESDLLEEVLEHSGAILAEKRAAQEACKTSESAAKIHYQALSSSTDAIRQAVASIAEHLPPDQDSCPLCLQPHGVATLQERVAKALQAINPNLTSAEQQLRAASEALIASEAEVASALEAVQHCQAKRGELDGNRQNLERQILELRIDPILASDSVLLAKESLRVQLEGITAIRRNLIDRRSSLQPLIAPEVLVQYQYAYEGAVNTLDQTRVQHSEALTRLDQAVKTLSDLTSSAPHARTLEELTIQRNQLDQRIRNLNGKVDAVQSELDAQQTQLLEFNSTIRSTEGEIRQAQSQLASLRADWQGLALTGDPLAETAQAKASALAVTLSDLENHLGALEIIGIEISAWAKLNESQLAQRLIDAQRLDRSEESFFAYINDRIVVSRRKLSYLTKLSDAMGSLDSFLKREIGNVQKHVSKVVPRWQALLKRVVRESRFHEASLKFFNAYNKDRAEVSVPLGSKSAPVPDVASEAQLTDLQLTFLLSMALSHQWSPWKALLLDDPTQHHDLVHASAVFDVLRDYIVDHGFQIVIATHDALQARYFLRKLQNDGIDAKIWKLVPTEHGVTAEEGHWKQRIR
ncbi:AAA family ATPase [Salinicola endophyticus]|uniref:AAA family ATPase n=1 Tax=Salinicola endophyticus TaxID=1949083 RepID=UPI00130041CC|nr:AAA family ATPase [Salinicola endophyticus]